MPFDPNDPDTKAALKAAVDEALSGKDDEIAALKENRDKVLKEKRELQKSASITPEQLAAVESERDELKANLTKAQKDAKDAATAAEKATKALETESGFTRKLLVENGLKDILIKGGVKDEDFLDALVTKFSQGATIVSEGDARKAMAGDKELSTVVTEYLASDAGKKFVAAPNNGGGGAQGGGGGSDGKSMKTSDFNALSPAERAGKMAEGYVLTDEAA